MDLNSIIFLLAFAYALILLAGILGLLALIEVRALKNSTHRVHLVPEGRYEPLTEEQKKKLSQDVEEYFENVM